MRLGLCLFLLISLAARANEPCERALSSAPIQVELERLRPLPLDLPTVREGVRKLIRNLTPLHGDFTDIQQINEDLAAGRLPPELARELLTEMRYSVEDRASEDLSKWDGRTRSGRELLEGYKILLKRLQASVALANSIDEKPVKEATEPELAETKAQEALRRLARKELAREAAREIRERDEEDSEIESMSADEFAKRMQEAAEKLDKRRDRMSSKIPDQTPDQMPESAKQVEQRLKQEPVPDAEQKVMDRILREAREKQKQKRAEQRQQEQQRQDAKRKERGKKSEEKEEDKGKAEAREKTEKSGEDQDNESEGEGQGQEEGESEGKGKSQGQGKKPGREGKEKGKGQEGTDEGADDSEGQADGEDQTGGRKANGQGGEETDTGETDSSEAAGDGQAEGVSEGESAGQPGGRKAQAESRNSDGDLSEYQRRAGAEDYDKLETADSGDEEFPENPGDGEIEGGGTLNQAMVQDLARFLKEMNLDEMRRSAEAQDVEPSREKETSAGPKEASFSPRPKPSRQKIEPTKPPQKMALESKKVELISALLKQLWERILNSYDSSEAFFSALNQYVTISNKYGAQLRVDAFRQEAARALEFYQQLRGQQVEYKAFSELAQSLAGTLAGDEGQPLLRKIKFIHTLLAEKNRLNLLSAKESALFAFTSKIMASLDGIQPGDQQIVDAFLKRMLGPLSFNAIHSQYAGADSQLNIGRLAADVREGRLNDFLLYPRLEPYINILLNTQEVPSSYWRYEGAEVPVNEADFELVQADEFDEMPKFYRDGAPLNLDLLRLLSGDMLRYQYRDPLEKFDPKKPKPKRVSVVLVDMSGSMGGANKFVLRNAIMLAYLDKAQRDVVRDGGEHVVYFIPFDAEPKPATRLATPGAAQEYFNNMRKSPLTAGGDDSITGAVVEAYTMISKEQEESGGGELETANILLLTDAVAPVDFPKIVEARKKIQGEVNVKLNALTMGDYNKDVTELVQSQGGSGAGALGEVYHQHIPYPEVQALLHIDPVDFVDDAKLEGKPIVLPPRLTEDLTRAAGGVANQFARARMNSTSTLQEVTTHLERTPSFEDGAQELNALFQELPNKAMTATWTATERAELLQRVVADFALQLQVEVAEVYSQLQPRTRDSLRSWLGAD